MDIHYTKHVECGGCGRTYPAVFPECPFCYVQEFLEVEANDGECPVCGYDPNDYDWLLGEDL